MSEHQVVKLQSHWDSGEYFVLAKLPNRPPVDDIAYSTGWWELDQIWRLYPGQFTVVTGITGHGKSTFMFNIVCNLAKKHGMRSFLYCPENEGFLQSTIKDIWGSDPGLSDFMNNQCFVQSADPVYYGTNEKQTLQWVLKKAKAVVEREAVDFILIDPWNEIERTKPKDLMMTDFIGEQLMHLKQFTRSHNVSVVLVAHPTKAVFDAGKARTPGLADIEGSMNWYNKCDNGLVVVREDGNLSRVISAKVRERGAGKVGCCHFVVDENTGRFTPQYGASG